MHGIIYGALLSWTLCVLVVLLFGRWVSVPAAILPRPLPPVPVTVEGNGPESHPRN
jgi:hypothetical protein